jgi:ubiquinone/menaquinone biosynthesis C-methylase UbiE
MVNMVNKKKEQIAKLWNQQAEFWAKEVRSGKDVFRDLFNNPEFLKFIGTIKNKKILDAGCGEGYNTRIFAKLGAHVTGVDLSKKMIHLAQEEEKKHPLDIDYRIASFSNLSDFKDESFDIVISFMALMDGPDYKEALQEFYRVLKTKGSLFFNIIHPCFLTPYYKRVQDEIGELKKVEVGNYFKEGPWKFSFHFAQKADKSDVKTFTSISYHRIISTYINNLIDAGFVLKKLGEPRPSEQACKKNPRLKKARSVASFLYVHAIKP